MSPELAKLCALAKNSPGPARDVLRDWLLADPVYGVNPEAVDDFMPALLKPDFRLALLIGDDRTFQGERHLRYLPMRLWNDWRVSAKAGLGPYSHPRKGGIPLDQYESFEIAVWPPNSKRFVNLLKHELFMPLAPGHKHPVLGYYLGDTVAGYVPYQVIQQLIDFLEEQEP